MDVVKRLVLAFAWLTCMVSVLQAAHAGNHARLLAVVSQIDTYPGSDFQTSCAYPDETTLSAVVPVATDHGSRASGIVIDNDRVLTAAHAIEGGGHFFVRLADTFLPAELIMVDHASDLAMLAVNTAHVSPLSISTFTPEQSDQVWAAGFPRTQSKTVAISVGFFQQAIDSTVHTSATIDPGQSGGALLGCTQGQWLLLGMLRGYGVYLQGDHYVKMNNHSVSVAGHVITTFLRSFQ